MRYSIELLIYYQSLKKKNRMSDSMSTKSCGITMPVLPTSGSLNPLKTMNSMMLTKIRKEIEVFHGVSSKCQEIWEALQKNQIAGSRLSEKVIDVVFQQYEADLYSYTRLSSLKDFMRLFDVDKDGFLNEDEQVSIFSYVKERVELVANNALTIHAYGSFKGLMKEVRQLEGMISKWQDGLRENIHQSQLEKYKKIGEERIDEFCLRYDQLFNDLMQQKIERKAQFQQEAMKELNSVNQRLQDPAEYLKIKPSSKVKYFQMQEKLVALEERVEEALDFRKELNELEVKEAQRVDKLVQVRGENMRENIRKKHQKMRKELDLKLDLLQNRLIIKMKRQYNILLKKNSLHENQIKRLQSIMGKWAMKKGTFYPELKRTKNLQRKQNEIIGDFKQVFKKPPALFDDDSSNAKTTAKKLLKQATNFSIARKELADLPVNSSSLFQSRSHDSKIGKFLLSQKSLSEISLCNLYDQNLNSLYQVAPAQNQRIYEAEVARKRNFILSKII